MRELKRDDSKFKDEEDPLAVSENEDEFDEAHKEKLIAIYYKLKRIFSEINCLGAPASIKDQYKENSFFMGKLVILSLLKDLKLSFTLKNEDKTLINRKSPVFKSKDDDDRLNNRKQELYEEMINFGLSFDLLLTTMERLKFLNEEYESFAEFDKNSLLKFLIPILYFESIEGKDDFILEFFFRNSIFEDDIMKKVKEDMQKVQNQNTSNIEKIAKIVYNSDIVNFYISSNIDKNIQNFLDSGVVNYRTYEDIINAIESIDKLHMELHRCKKKFIYDLKNYKNNDRNTYNQFKFTSYGALEDFYTEEIIEKHANIETINADCENIAKTLKQFDSNEKIQFFSAENFEKMKEIPLFQKNLDMNQIFKLTDQLAGLFRQFQIVKGDAGKEVFTHLLILFKEKSKLSKKASRSLEFLLAKISFSLKSNYNNLKIMLDFLLKKDIDPNDFEALLAKLDINQWTFYGLAIPHLKMSVILNNSRDNLFLKNLPDFLLKMIKFPSEIINDRTISQILPEKKSWNNFVNSCFFHFFYIFIDFLIYIDIYIKIYIFFSSRPKTKKSVIFFRNLPFQIIKLTV